MRLLVTAGNTLAMIDRVRCLTNVFTGRTGAAIALHAFQRGHTVTLLTSRVEFTPPECDRFATRRYRTFEDLARELESAVRSGGFDAVVHCAAVSDYLCAGVYAPEAGTAFDPADRTWRAPGGEPRLADRAAGKVKSDAPELWLRLTRAPKLVDQLRTPWGFRGVLVKFKLEVGVAEGELLEVAERSRRESGAELMVANALETAGEWAYLGPVGGGYEKVPRGQLPERLVGEIERVIAAGAGPPREGEAPAEPLGGRRSRGAD